MYRQMSATLSVESEVEIKKYHLFIYLLYFPNIIYYDIVA
jgi:hypothetical protein